MPPSNSDWFGPHDDTGQNWHECAPRVPGAAHGAPVTLPASAYSLRWQDDALWLDDALSPPFPPPASWRPDPLSPAIFIALLNRLRSLRIGELRQAGVWRGIPQPQLGREYHLFRSNPADYLLRADNATRDRIWRLLVAGAAA